MFVCFRGAQRLSARVLATMFLYVSCKHFPYHEYGGSKVNDEKYTHGVWVQIPGSTTFELCVILGRLSVLTFLIYKMGITVGLVAKLYECVAWYWTLIKHSEGLKCY